MASEIDEIKKLIEDNPAQDDDVSVPSALPPPAPVASPNVGPAPESTPEIQQPTPTPYADTSKPGALSLTPGQAVAGFLNLSAGQQNLAGQQGNIESDTAAQLAAVQDKAAAEKAQQAADYQQALAKTQAQLEADHARMAQAYQDYSAKAGSLKDPSQQFWEDHGQGSRILAGFIGAASGLGAGLLGQAGNPFLTFLNHQIDNNFEAHKQNIHDLYDKQVAAGHIADTDQNYQKFMQDAKLKGYDLASMHIQNELQAIADRSGSQIAKVKAAEAINQLQQQDVQRRAQYGAQLAAQAAAANAQARAKQAKLQEDFLKQVNAHVTAGLPEDQARYEAFNDLQSAGNDRSALAALAAGNNIPYNPKTEQFEAPKADIKTDSIIPVVDPDTGRRLKPEEREAMRQLVVPTPEGPRLANSPDDAKRYKEEANANIQIQEYVDQVRPLVEKWKKGTLTNEDIGRWEGLRTAALTSYNRAGSGGERATGQGESKILGEDAFPPPPSIAYNAIVGGSQYSPVRIPGSIGYEGKYLGQLDALENAVKENNKTLEQRLRPATSSNVKKEAVKEEDLTKKPVRFKAD